MAIETKVETVEEAGVARDATKAAIVPESVQQAEKLILAHRELGKLPVGVVAASISQWHEGEEVKTRIEYVYADKAEAQPAIDELLAKAKLSVADVAPAGVVDAGTVTEEVIP